MPNPDAAIPLTYKATDIQHADFGIFLEILQGLQELPGYRGKDTIVPALAGRVEGNRVADNRVIVLNGWVKGTGVTPKADFRTKVGIIQALFDPTAPGDLVATLETGDTATIRARTTNLIWGLPEGAFYTQLLSVELESVSPNWVIT